MKIGTTPLIAENIAPDNASSLAIFNGNTKVCDIDITKMQPSNLGEKLYSFGLLSDIHMTGDSQVGTKEKDGNGYITDGFYFKKALGFFDNQQCNFVCVSGDLTDIGFWGESSRAYRTDQFEEYKNICSLYPDLPVYAVCGNHESYTDIYSWGHSITDNLAELLEYTGTPLYYTITSGDSVNPTVEGGNIHNSSISNTDVFVMFGQPSSTANSTWNSQIDWLEATLEANKGKRCFVFEHLTLNMDSGNPENVHNAYWGTYENRLVSILNKYNNVILFHGHSHMRFEEQTKVSYSNYSTQRGFKSVHIPSTSYTRYMADKNGDGVWNSGDKENIPDGAQGYICDVYKNHIVLKGYDFQFNNFVPIAQYCIDTTITR